MLFKKCKFPGKANIKKDMKNNIINKVKQEIPFDKCNEGNVFDYIDFLIDESEYDKRSSSFYFKYRYIRIDLDVDLFSKVATEYINEHLDDFLLTKYK